MYKTYRYRGLTFPVPDNEDVTLTVKFISDGNTGHTVINVPGTNDPEIANEGSVLLGKGSELRSGCTVSFSDIVNLAPEEDTLHVEFCVNGKLLQQHSNPKTETESAYIVLFIEFPSAV